MAQQPRAPGAQAPSTEDGQRSGGDEAVEPSEDTREAGPGAAGTAAADGDGAPREAGGEAEAGGDAGDGADDDAEAAGGGDGEPGGDGEAAGAEAAQLPAGHPPVAAGQQTGEPGQRPGGPHGASPHSRAGDILRPPSLASAEPSEDVPPGAIRVTVVDERGRPVPDAPVDVGVLAQGERSRHQGRTEAEGVVTFSGLPTGTSQAYRVNAPHEGATYSSSPFQLPTDRGYAVRLTRLPVTRQDRFVFFHVFRTIVEQQGERMHVIHQAQLTNAGSETFVFPPEGLTVALPEEALNFQTQRVMTDQRVEEVPGQDAYRLSGSLPPGTVQLAWAYDMPLDGEELSIPVQVPLRFFGLQVIAEALPGLRLDATALPEPQRISQESAPCVDSVQTPGCVWLTQIRRGPEQPSLERLTIRLSGIPGPSPVRWIAVALAGLLVLGGIFFAAQREDQQRSHERARQQRRAQLLEEARALDAELEAGEIGPEFRQKRRAAIVRELAVLLHQEDASAGAEASSATGRRGRS